jgi:hypothetical protein
MRNAEIKMGTPNGKKVGKADMGGGQETEMFS